MPLDPGTSTVIPCGVATDLMRSATSKANGQRIGSRYYYRVRFGSSPVPVEVAEPDLEEVIFGKGVWDLLRDGAFADKETLSRLITFERLQSPLDDNLYALRASRTAFQPYQFKPLLKFLRSPKQRLLLADEVGLGKTIEAGFILTEIMAGHPRTLRRVLVVCKASLCPKWQMEMRIRFDLRFEIWKSDRAMAFLDEFIQDPDAEIRAICSLESFRSRGVMERWEECNGPHFLDTKKPFLRWWAALKMKESQCPERVRVTPPA